MKKGIAMICSLLIRTLAHFAMLVFVGVCLVLWPHIVQAATIPVNTTVPSVVNDAQCGLAEAIVAANNNMAGNGCLAGDDTPMDTIVLATDAVYSLPSSFADYEGATGLPSITS